MFNLETFVNNLSLFITGSQFSSDAKTEGSDDQTKYYLKLSSNDKDYRLKRASK